MIKLTMDMKTIYRSTEQPLLEQPQSPSFEDQRMISSGNGSVAQEQTDQGSNATPLWDQVLFTNEPSYVGRGQPSLSFSGQTFGLDRHVSNQTELDRLNDETNVTISRLVTGNQEMPLGGNSTQQGSDEASDNCKAGNIHNFYSKEIKFAGDYKKSIEVTFQLFKHYSRQNNLPLDQMANLFITALDRLARLFFLRNVRMGNTYEWKSNDASRK